MERALLYFVLAVFSGIFLFELFSDKHSLDGTLNVEVGTDERKTNKKRKTRAKMPIGQNENEPEIAKPAIEKSGQEPSQAPATDTGDKRMIVVINNGRQAEVSETEVSADDEQSNKENAPSRRRMNFAPGQRKETGQEKESVLPRKMNFAHQASGMIGTTADRDVPWFLM